MDRITLSMLKEFDDNMGIEEKEPTLNFEYFVNYSIISDDVGVTTPV